MKKVPIRKCIACNNLQPKKDLYRIVKTPNNEIIVDTTGKLSGRGTYICSLECLNKAIKTKRIEREFEMPLTQETYQKLIEDITTHTK